METPPATPIRRSGFDIIQPVSGSNVKHAGYVSSACTSGSYNAAVSKSRSSEFCKEGSALSTECEAFIKPGVVSADITSTASAPGAGCSHLWLDDDEGLIAKHVERPSARSPETTAVNLPPTPPDTPDAQCYCFHSATSNLQLGYHFVSTECGASVNHSEHTTPLSPSPRLAQTTSRDNPNLTSTRLDTRRETGKHLTLRHKPGHGSISAGSFASLGIEIKAGPPTALLTRKRSPEATFSPLHWLRPLRLQKERGSSDSLHVEEDEHPAGLEGWGRKEHEMSPRERALERRRVLVGKLVYYIKLGRRADEDEVSKQAYRRY